MVQNVEMLAVGVTHGVFTVKLLLLVPVPLGVVTANNPVVAPDGTVNMIVVLFETLKTTGLPFRVTEVAPVKLVPVIVTVVPAVPLVGVKEVTVGTGADTQLKFAAQPSPPLAALLVKRKVS